MAGSRPGPTARPRVGESYDLPGSPSIYLSVERTPIMRLARTLDNRAWQAGAYGAIFRANQRIARRVQERAVANLGSRIVRPAQRTGLLETAVSSPEAVYADAQRIVIGVGDFLDTKASYWRAVEGGAPGLKGMVAFGFWTNAPRGASGPLGPPMRGVKTGRPIILSWNVPPPTGSGKFFTWTIEHPTEPHWYFLDAWIDVGASGYMERVYREEFRKVIGLGGKPVNLGRTFRAYHGRPLLGQDFHLR